MTAPQHLLRGGFFVCLGCALLFVESERVFAQLSIRGCVKAKGTEIPLTLTLSLQGRGDSLGRLSACLTPSPLTGEGGGTPPDGGQGVRACFFASLCPELVVRRMLSFARAKKGWRRPGTQPRLESRKTRYSVINRGASVLGINPLASARANKPSTAATPSSPRSSEKSLTYKPM